MRRALRLHPDSVRGAVTRIEAEIAREGADRLTLHYLLSGRTGDVIWPAPAQPQRTDELWRHTCFELFVRAAGVAGYYEFNFSPSTRWAAYRFDGYRSGMAPADGAPQITVRPGAELFEMDVSLDLPAPLAAAGIRLAITAVVEESGGRMSYWALTHPPGKPDFHHPDGFTLELPAP